MKMTNTELKLRDTGQAKVVNNSRPPFFFTINCIHYMYIFWSFIDNY